MPRSGHGQSQRFAIGLLGFRSLAAVLISNPQVIPGVGIRREQGGGGFQFFQSLLVFALSRSVFPCRSARGPGSLQPERNTNVSVRNRQVTRLAIRKVAGPTHF